jgi:hypothetical protein
VKTQRGAYSRRRVLGVGGASLLAGLAGCLSGGGTSSTSGPGSDDDGSDGNGVTTYTHGRYGYSLQLPSAWSVQEDVVEDGVSFSSVVSIPDEDDEVGRIYVNDIPNAHSRNNVVDEFVATGTDHWDTVETDEIAIADGQVLPVATVSTGDYLQVRWLSVVAGTTRFDVVPAVWMTALTPAIGTAVDDALRSFSLPESAPDDRGAVSAGVGSPTTGTHALAASAPQVGTSEKPLLPLAVQNGQASAAATACGTHEQKLGEINAEATRLEGRQGELVRGHDAALDGLMDRFKENSGEGLPGLVNAFDLIEVLCDLVNAFMAGRNALYDRQQAVRGQRVDAAKALRECREENPDSAPGRPTGSVTGITRGSITLDLENVPMERFSLRFITDSGDGVERLEHIGPLEAPGGRFTGTVTFSDHGFSAQNKKVRSIAILIPVEGSGSDRPATGLTVVSDPYGDYDNR